MSARERVSAFLDLHEASPNTGDHIYGHSSARGEGILLARDLRDLVKGEGA